jgi:hypothetical protein
VYETLISELVVVNTDSRFSYIGMVEEVTERGVRLSQVTVYDADESRVQLEEYLIESVAVAPTVTRAVIWVAHNRVVAVSKMKDIVPP